MEDGFVRFANFVAVCVEGAAALFIAVGAIEATLLSARAMFRTDRTLGARREAWLRFARWLVLALEFELAADIIRSAVTPSWNDIGQLAAIAVIRTFLNYFLEKDIECLEPRRASSEGP